jgi:hypothetical protein
MSMRVYPRAQSLRRRLLLWKSKSCDFDLWNHGIDLPDKIASGSLCFLDIHHKKRLWLMYEIIVYVLKTGRRTDNFFFDILAPKSGAEWPDVLVKKSPKM